MLVALQLNRHRREELSCTNLPPRGTRSVDIMRPLGLMRTAWLPLFRSFVPLPVLFRPLIFSSAETHRPGIPPTSRYRGRQLCRPSFRNPDYPDSSAP